MRTVYLAAPLFSEAELDFNRRLKDEEHRQEIIFNKNMAGLENSDIIVAVIDGTDVDSGTAWEIGYAYAKGKPVLGLRTDFRTLGIEGTVNLMIESSVILCKSIPELLNRLKAV